MPLRCPTIGQDSRLPLSTYRMSPDIWDAISTWVIYFLKRPACKSPFRIEFLFWPWKPGESTFQTVTSRIEFLFLALKTGRKCISNSNIHTRVEFQCKEKQWEKEPMSSPAVARKVGRWWYAKFVKEIVQIVHSQWLRTRLRCRT